MGSPGAHFCSKFRSTKGLEVLAFLSFQGGPTPMFALAYNICTYQFPAEIGLVYRTCEYAN